MGVRFAIQSSALDKQCHRKEGGIVSALTIKIEFVKSLKCHPDGETSIAWYDEIVNRSPLPWYSNLEIRLFHSSYSTRYRSRYFRND